MIAERCRLLADAVPLTVKLSGKCWKARVNISLLMTNCTLDSVRKFVRLYLKPMTPVESNLQAVRQIIAWFPCALDAAKNAWIKASQDYNNGFQTQHVYPFKPTKAQAAHNRKLLKAVEDAKKVYDRLEKRRKVFLEECAAYHVPIEL